MRRVHESSPTLAAADSRLDGLRRAEERAGRLPDPVLDLRMENWRSSPDFETDSDLDVTVVAIQSLDLFGARTGRKREAAGERSAAEAARRAASVDLQISAVQGYLGAFYGQRMTETLEAQVERLRDIVRTLQRRTEEGYGPEADLMKFRSELGRAENLLVRTRVQRDRGAAVLEGLLAEPVDPVRLVDPGILPPPEGDAETLAETSLEILPEPAAARAEVERSEGNREIEDASRFPDLLLSGGYKRTEGLDTAILGVGFTVPLWNRNARERLRAEGDALAAARDLEAAERRSRAETAALIRAARDLAERARRTDDEVLRPAETARAAALAAFREGAADVLQLVDAERVWVEARRESLEIAAQAFLTSFEARLATGQEVLP